MARQDHVLQQDGLPRRTTLALLVDTDNSDLKVKGSKGQDPHVDSIFVRERVIVPRIYL